MWLDGFFFQGQYLLCLSIKCVAINKDLEKRSPQLDQINIKNCYEQGYNDIRAVTVTKWRHYLFYLQPYFSALKLFSNIVHRSFFPQLPPPMFAKFERNMWERYRDILELKSLFLVWNTVKQDNLDLRPLSLQTGECGLRRCKTFHN